MLLDWYDTHRRALPWRALPGERPDAYRVWLSEIMLQQTTVATVKGYYAAFLKRWPAVEALAAAPLEDVLHAWQGLGYYSRARNLHACARTIVENYQGQWPQTPEELQRLPGIGAYTSAAIAAIAFGQPAAVLDTNIERILTRLQAWDIPVKQNRRALEAEAAQWMCGSRPGDVAQALMDLGSLVCTARTPQCLLCPLCHICLAYQTGQQDRLPVRPVKAPRPTRYAWVFWLTDGSGRVLVRQRPPSGLLGGMTEFPSSPWQEPLLTQQQAIAHAPVSGLPWTAQPGTVGHTFSHFHLQLTLLKARLTGEAPSLEQSYWQAPDALSALALPTVMKKVARAALA